MFRLDQVSELKKGQLYTLAIIFVILLILGGIAAWKWNQIKTWFASAKTSAEFNKDITKSNLTITKTQAKTYADQLYTAMKGFGTDEDTIFTVFNRIETNDDLNLILSQFGIRDNETLPQWLIGDLSSSDRRKLNQILAGKGIDYAF